MVVRQCTNIAPDLGGLWPDINQKTTPQEFDRDWTLPIAGSCAWGMHPMILAAEVGNTILMCHLNTKDRSLLDLGNRTGSTPLMYAVFHEQFEAAENLLDWGADPNVATIQPFLNDNRIPQGTTSLWLAAQRIKSISMTKLLFEYGAVAAPALEKDGQLILEQAKEELAQENVALTVSINEAIEGFPSSIVLIIVEYL